MSAIPDEAEVILAERMRALRRLRPAIEHELRSGLNSVVLNVELLAAQIDRLEAFDDPEIGREVETLRDMVLGLREGSVALTRRIEMTMRTVLPSDAPGGAEADLTEMVRNLAVFLAFEARLLGVRCETELPPAMASLPVPGRRSLVQAALLSLAAAALGVAAPGGALCLSLAAEGEWAVVGIAAEPFEGEAPPEHGQGLEAICVALGAVFDSKAEGEARRFRLRLPRQT